MKRPWYHVTAKEMIECGGRKRNRFAPNMMVEEPGKWTGENNGIDEECTMWRNNGREQGEIALWVEGG